MPFQFQRQVKDRFQELPQRGTTLISWLLTTTTSGSGCCTFSHCCSIFTIAAIAAAMMPSGTLTPAGDMVTSETYNTHDPWDPDGLVFPIPSIPGGAGQFCAADDGGARDVAFPKLNLLSWYLFNAGGLLALYAVVFGGEDTGWTFLYAVTAARTRIHT